MFLRAFVAILKRVEIMNPLGTIFKISKIFVGIRFGKAKKNVSPSATSVSTNVLQKDQTFWLHSANGKPHPIFPMG